MKTLSYHEAANGFPMLLEQVQQGTEIAITRDGNQEIIAVIAPYSAPKKTAKRELGTLQNKMSVSFAPDFKMTDEELCGLKLSGIS